MGAYATQKTMKDDDFDRIAEFVESSVGIKMPRHKKCMAELRLNRRLRTLGMETFEEYCDFVFADESEERIWVIDALTTNKTDFFREPEHFERLAGEVLPQALAHSRQLGTEVPYRIWSAGCSTGEEPYTIAMTMLEFGRDREPIEFEIIATDISIEVLRTAHRGVYTKERSADVPPELLKRYFLKSSDPSSERVRVAPEVRQRITFGMANLLDVESYPAEPLDAIFCRNVMIYFHRETQIAILQAMYERLRPGGHLFVGHSETLHGMGLPFVHVAPTLYRRAD